MARSFSAVGGPDALLQRLTEVRRAVPSPAGGIVFVSGPLAQRPGVAADLVREAWRGVPACVAPAAGVLSERGEIEGQPAAAGLLWEGGSTSVLAPPGGGLAEAVGAALGRRAGTAVIFARPDALAPDELTRIGAAAPGACVLGAGTVGAGPLAVRASGEVVEGATAGLVITGLASPLVEAASACRLLSEFHPIEEVADAGLVLRVGGRPALDQLSAATAGLATRGAPPPVVLVALADPADLPGGSPTSGAPGAPGASGAPGFVIRPVRGIDTARRGVMLGEAVRPGVRLAFAVRDGAVARAGLEEAARRVARSALGSAPRFALHLSCAGRGQGLYGAPDVEVRILRQRFPELPIAGMHSAFEIAPSASGKAQIALYTGVLALFRAPS